MFFGMPCIGGSRFENLADQDCPQPVFHFWAVCKPHTNPFGRDPDANVQAFRGGAFRHAWRVRTVGSVDNVDSVDTVDTVDSVDSFGNVKSVKSVKSVRSVNS